jgi:hypothetical protein
MQRRVCCQAAVACNLCPLATGQVITMNPDAWSWATLVANADVDVCLSVCLYVCLFPAPFSLGKYVGLLSHVMAKHTVVAVVALLPIGDHVLMGAGATFGCAVLEQEQLLERAPAQKARRERKQQGNTIFSVQDPGIGRTIAIAM